MTTVVAGVAIDEAESEIKSDEALVEELASGEYHPVTIEQTRERGRNGTGSA